MCGDSREHRGQEKVALKEVAAAVFDPNHKLGV